MNFRMTGGGREFIKHDRMSHIYFSEQMCVHIKCNIHVRRSNGQLSEIRRQEISGGKKKIHWKILNNLHNFLSRSFAFFSVRGAFIACLHVDDDDDYSTAAIKWSSDHHKMKEVRHLRIKRSSHIFMQKFQRCLAKN